MTAPSSSVRDFIFEQSSNGILVIGGSGRIEAVNPAAAALVGSAREQLLDCTPPQAFADLPALLDLCTDQAAGDLTLPAGRFAAGSATTLADGRRVVLLVDTTAERSLDQHREDLLLRIAHDLRNPVASLIGYVDLVETLGELSADQRYFLDRTRETGMKFYAMIADLVDLAWMEANMPFRRVPLALDEILEAAVTDLRPIGLGLGVKIVADGAAGLPPVSGNPERLRTLIDKLLHNAIIYSLDGQTVTVRAWSDGQSVFCAFRDEGIGIAENERELVFDRLYRSPDPRVQSIPGGGLGLTTARRIVLQHGGELWLESVLDGGSTFTFRLPATSA